MRGMVAACSLGGLGRWAELSLDGASRRLHRGEAGWISSGRTTLTSAMTTAIAMKIRLIRRADRRSWSGVITVS